MQIVIEMIELRETDTARALLRGAEALTGMKQEEPDRYLRLEHLLVRPYFDVREVCVPFYHHTYCLIHFIVATCGWSTSSCGHT